MGSGPRVLISEPCECGDRLQWRSRGLINTRWRLECICGRCGPWRRYPNSEKASPFKTKARAETADAERDQWRTSAMTGLEEITKLRAEKARLLADLASAREGRNYAD